MEGKFPGWTPERTYNTIVSMMRREGSKFLEERPPSFLRATQGRGRLLRTFDVSLESNATGTHVWIQVRSPEDWPVHAKAALRLAAIGIGVSTAGVVATAASLAFRLGDIIIVSILLFGAGAPIIVTGWARWQNAKRLIRGQATALWLSGPEA